MGTKKPMSKKPRQILFSKNTYNPKVKITHWEYQMLAEKKDNYVYRDSLSNHVSTYRRLGDQEDKFITETGHMLGQILTKKDFIYSFKPMKNCNSYPDAESPESTEDPELEFCSSPYITTHQSNYRNPHPTVMKPLSMPSVPWLLNRVICSDLTQNYGTAPPAATLMYIVGSQGRFGALMMHPRGVDIKQLSLMVDDHRFSQVTFQNIAAIVRPRHVPKHTSTYKASDFYV